ncbi:MAG: heavy metal translocating P-type ATPase metal-binding domain-containing protein [Bdellovibrionota bacterium]
MESQTKLQTQCLHCRTLFFAGPDSQFCCSGCAFVFQLLEQKNLTDFYKIRELDPPQSPVPVQPVEDSFEYCDDKYFLTEVSKDARELTFFLEGVNCTACVWLLDKLPEICSSVEASTINFPNSTIHIRRTEAGTFALAAETLARLGFNPRAVSNKNSLETFKKTERKLDLIRIGIAGACTGNIMIFAVSNYAGATDELRLMFNYLIVALAFPVLTFCAFPFYRNAWAALRTKNLNLDLPIVISILAGVVMGLHGLITGAENIYFDSLSMLVFLLLSSRFWLKGIQQKFISANHIQDHLLVRQVTVLTDKLKSQISSMLLKEGQLVEIRSGMVIPADGVVIRGTGQIQTAILTGESSPILVKTWDTVEAGTYNIEGDWVLKVSRPPLESRFAELLESSKKALLNKPTQVKLADNVGRWFILTTFALALLTFAFNASSGTAEAFSRALALLIVTCPCVFGMAIPLSISFAIRAAAQNDIIVKDGSLFERLLNVRHLFFDKTGTLTDGQLKVTSVHCNPANLKYLKYIYALERNQKHPVATALKQYFYNSDEMDCGKVQELVRGGLQAVIDGSTYSITPIALTNNGFENQIKSEFAFSKDGSQIAAIKLVDQLREEAPEVFAWAKREKFSTTILSGDQPATVIQCARELGLTSDLFRSRLSANEKAEIIAPNAGTSMMIGDGANDAQALATAGVGIAITGALDVSLKAADAYLMQPDLRKIPRLFEIARKTDRAIKRNLSISASFNLIAGTIAISGHMTPLWAAVFMPLSSLIVLASAIITGTRLTKQIETLKGIHS